MTTTALTARVICAELQMSAAVLATMFRREAACQLAEEQVEDAATLLLLACIFEEEGDEAVGATEATKPQTPTPAPLGSSVAE